MLTILYNFLNSLSISLNIFQGQKLFQNADVELLQGLQAKKLSILMIKFRRF